MPADRPLHYPVMLDVARRLCIVVGGAAAARRAASTLVRYGADVVVITPEPALELLELESAGDLTIEQRGYVRGDLEGAMLAIAASGSVETDAAVVDEARQRNVLVSVPTDSGASTFITPSVVTRGDLQIAITTEGTAPFVAKQVRREIAAAYGEEWGTYVSLVSDLRAIALSHGETTRAELDALFAFAASSEVLERVRAGETVEAASVYEEYTSSTTEETSEPA